MFKGKLENMSGCSDSNNDVRFAVIRTFPQWFSSMAWQSFIDVVNVGSSKSFYFAPLLWFYCPFIKKAKIIT